MYWLERLLCSNCFRNRVSQGVNCPFYSNGIQAERVFIRMAPKEKRRLIKRAECYNMTASDFFRTLLVHFEDGFIDIVDIEAIRRALRKLVGQGMSLNQLMKLLNTNGVSSYDSDSVQQIPRKETQTLEQVANSLIALRNEMRNHSVVLGEGDDGTKL